MVPAPSQLSCDISLNCQQSDLINAKRHVGESLSTAERILALIRIRINALFRSWSLHDSRLLAGSGKSAACVCGARVHFKSQDGTSLALLDLCMTPFEHCLLPVNDARDGCILVILLLVLQADELSSAVTASGCFLSL